MKQLRSWVKKGLIGLCFAALLCATIFKTNLIPFFNNNQNSNSVPEQENKESFFDIQKIGGGAIAAAALAGLAYKMYTEAQQPKRGNDEQTEEFTQELPAVALPTNQEMLPNVFVYSGMYDQEDKIAVPLIVYQQSKTLQNMLEDLQGTETSVQKTTEEKSIPLDIAYSDLYEIIYLVTLHQTSAKDFTHRIAQMPLKQLGRIINGVHDRLDIDSLNVPLLNACMKKIKAMDMQQIMDSSEITGITSDIQRKLFVTFITTTLENACIEQYARNNEICLAKNLSRPSRTDTRDTIAFSSDGINIACASNDTLLLYNLTTDNLLQAISGDAKNITHIIFSPGNRKVVSGDWNGGLVLWNIEATQLVPVKLQKFSSTSPTCIQFSFDETKLAAGYDDGRLYIFKSEDNYVKGIGYRQHTEHSDVSSNSITGIVFSPDNKKFISSACGEFGQNTFEKKSTESNNLIMWYFAEETPMPTILSQSGSAGFDCMKMSADGRIIILGKYESNYFSVVDMPWDQSQYSLKNVVLPEGQKLKNLALIGNDTKIAIIAAPTEGYFSDSELLLHIYSVDSTTLESTHLLQEPYTIDGALFSIDGTRFVSYSYGDNYNKIPSSITLWNIDDFFCKKICVLSDIDDEIVSINYRDNHLVAVRKNSHSGAINLYLYTLVTKEQQRFIKTTIDNCNQEQLRYLFAACLERSYKKSKKILLISEGIHEHFSDVIKNFLVGGPLIVPQQGI